MKTHTLIQGSAEWHAYRASVWNASDASAMMGCSPYKTRDQLLQELATGVAEEVTPEQQRRFDDGHRFEALARPLAEEITGEELAPVVGSSDTVIAGRALSASFDGIDFMETVAFEHKSLNQQLRECMEGLDESDRLPLHYRVQMEQQLVVSGAMRILFMASKWNGADLVEERHCWYYPDAKLREQILAGWAQLAEDLAKWQPQAVEVKPVGKSPEHLPALHIEIAGQVTASNFDEFKKIALDRIRSVNTTLETDQDFADADLAVKWCEEVESRVEAAAEHALSQTADVYSMLKALEEVKAESARVRLDLSKKVKARKDQLKSEIVHGGVKALADHIAALNTGLGATWVQSAPGSLDLFADAVKNKRSFDSMREAVNNVLAQAKIVANQAAERFKANRAAMVIEGRDWIDLFPDFALVGNKPAEDFDAVLQLRIGKHQEAERAIQQAATPAVQPMATAPVAQVAAPVAQVAPMTVAAPAANEAATVKLGEICANVGAGFSMTAAFVEQVLGIAPAKVDKAARLYTPTDERRIYAALRDHLNGLLMAKAA